MCFCVCGLVAAVLFIDHTRAFVAYFPPMNSSPTVVSTPHGFRTDLLRWRQLVSADWLSAWLVHDGVPGEPESVWHLFEVGCDGLHLFETGHLPGARYLDTHQFERPPFWNQTPDAALLHLLQSLGLGPDSTVILYARNTLAAARVAQLLLYAGVRDVRLLDGGLQAWCAAGYGLASGAQAPANVPVCPAPWGEAFPAYPGYCLNLAQARALALRSDAALVSIRSHAEWMGETSGYRYIAARGEIDSALWGQAGRDGDINSMSSFQDAQGRMKATVEIEAVWADAGIHRDLHIAFYCGTGWRASLAFFYAWLMGWERISVFDGGWFEWSSDPGNPVVCRSEQAAFSRNVEPHGIASGHSEK